MAIMINKTPFIAIMINKTHNHHHAVCYGKGRSFWILFTHNHHAVCILRYRKGRSFLCVKVNEGGAKGF